jgi:hypothetical protein
MSSISLPIKESKQVVDPIGFATNGDWCGFPRQALIQVKGAVCFRNLCSTNPMHTGELKLRRAEPIPPAEAQEVGPF